MYRTKSPNSKLVVLMFLDLENLSYRKPTWQSYTYAEFGSSDKAVDGRKSRHYRDGQCTITSQTSRNTWLVNLEKKYRIAFITLYLRTDNSTFCMSTVIHIIIVNASYEYEILVSTKYCKRILFCCVFSFALLTACGFR